MIIIIVIIIIIIIITIIIIVMNTSYRLLSIQWNAYLAFESTFVSDIEIRNIQAYLNILYI